MDDDIVVIPAFHRWPNEASILGKLLAAFGELEYMTMKLAGTANGNLDPILKAMYRLRATSSRIDAADALMRPTFVALSLIGEYGQTIGALRYCLRIRNQFAHCAWGDHEWSGLFFVDLEESAKRGGQGWDHDWLHVDTALLKRHYAYFAYARAWLFYLEYRLARWRGESGTPAFPKPKAQDQPPPHNPRSQHIPVWLSEDQKALHLKRAREVEANAPLPRRKRAVPIGTAKKLRKRK